MDSNMIQLEKI